MLSPWLSSSPLSACDAKSRIRGLAIERHSYAFKMLLEVARHSIHRDDESRHAAMTLAGRAECTSYRRGNQRNGKHWTNIQLFVRLATWTTWTTWTTCPKPNGLLLARMGCSGIGEPSTRWNWRPLRPSSVTT